MISLTKSLYQGEIRAPSSKSDAHRALIAAALCPNGISEIRNVSFSNDIKATMSCLESLGATFIIKGNKVYVNGISTKKDIVNLYPQESGSTLRFLIPLASYLSSNVTFHLSDGLSKRPLDIFKNIFTRKGVKWNQENTLLQLEGFLRSGTYVIDGSVSSQFISGLLFFLPLLKESSRIFIKNTISSKSYILMTIDTLKKFKVKINFDEDNQIIEIKGDQHYIATNYVVENDYSQASFFLALGTISKPITINGLRLHSYQPDKNILPILRGMNATLKIEGNKVTSYPSELRGSKISLDECPDIGPILIGLATFCKEKTTFINIRRLRIKESDRIESMIYNLTLLGIKCELPDDNTLIVYPGELHSPSKPLIPFNDHRIFMTLAVITSHLESVQIEDENCINKSYPNFLNDLESLKIKE